MLLVSSILLDVGKSLVGPGHGAIVPRGFLDDLFTTNDNVADEGARYNDRWNWAGVFSRAWQLFDGIFHIILFNNEQMREETKM